MQLAINIGISAFLFALAGAGIGLTQAATRQIPFTFAATMSIVAYTCHGLYGNGCPFFLAILLSVTIGAVIACILDFYVLRPLDAVQAAWASIAVSLGVYVLNQAALAIAFGEAGRTFSIGHASHAIGNGWVTQLQLAMGGTSIGVIGSLLTFLRFGRFGRAIRGLASNPELCELFGIRTSLVRAVAVGLGGGLTGLAAVFTSVDSGLIPSTGFSLFLFGATASIIGGVGSSWGIAWGALLLAVARHSVAYYGDPKWMDAAAFLILVGFLIWKPLGFSGRRLKKVDI